VSGLVAITELLFGCALLFFPLQNPIGGQAGSAGVDLFKAKCAGCHGAEGSGKAGIGIRDLGSPDVQNKSNAELASIIANGTRKMPAYKGKLTDAQIADIVSYIRDLKK
jgi:cytochrome c6